MAVAAPEDEGKPTHININNVVVVSALRKRRSDDRLAHTLISALYLVARALGCWLCITWVPRRSKVPTKIADNPHTNRTHLSSGSEPLPGCQLIRVAYYKLLRV
jgi:hypothetical protein